MRILYRKKSHFTNYPGNRQGFSICPSSVNRTMEGDLRPDHIQGLYDLRLAEGGTPHTIKRIHKVLHCALEQGVKPGLLVRNPATATSPPKLKHKEMSFYTEEQVKQFLWAAKVF